MRILDDLELDMVTGGNKDTTHAPPGGKLSGGLPQGKDTEASVEKLMEADEKAQ